MVTKSVLTSTQPSGQVPASAADGAGAPFKESPALENTRSLSWALAAIILIESLYVLWTASRGFFYQDDFVDLAVAKQLGIGGRLLEQPVFGHFIPGYNLVNYLVASVTPYRWPIIESADVAIFAASLILLSVVMRLLFGHRWLIAPLVALAGASFAMVPSIDWWASGLQLTAITATLMLLIFHIRFMATGRIRFAILGSVALAVALAFYDGALVAAMFLVLMTVLIWPVGPGLKGAAQTLVEYWPAWICYGVVVAMDLGWRFTHAALYYTPPLPIPRQALEFISLSWTQTFVPLVFGVDPWLLANHGERVVIGGLGQVVALTVIAVTILWRPVAWRAWILLAITFLAFACLVGLTRVSLFGAGDASDVRYVAFDAFFLVICLGLVLMPVRQEAWSRKWAADRPPPCGVRKHRHSPRPDEPQRARRRTVMIGIPVVCAIVALYALALLFDQDHDNTVQGTHASRTFFTTFKGSWGVVTSKALHPFLWDTEVNPIVVSHAFFPDDVASVTVGRLNEDLHFDEWGGSGFILNADGSVAPAIATTYATGVFPNSGPACVTAGNTAVRIEIPLDHSLAATRWFGFLSYQTPESLTVQESGGDVVRFPKGSGTLITDFSPTPLSSVAWSIPAQHHLCLTGLRIVLPRPLSSGYPAVKSLDAQPRPIAKTPQVTTTSSDPASMFALSEFRMGSTAEAPRRNSG